MTSPDTLQPALALVELASIAVGIETGDAMVKRAPVEVVRAGTIHPGRYLVLVTGAVGDVEEALRAGLEVGGAGAATCRPSSGFWAPARSRGAAPTRWASSS